MSPTIREAQPDDLVVILDMIRALAAFEDLTDEVVFDPAAVGQHLFGDDRVASVALAEVDGEVAGMALWFRTFSTFLGRPGIWLEDLFVWPRFRGRGVGRALLHHLRAATSGRLEWNVLGWNQQAIDVYEGIGARPGAGSWITYRWDPP